MMEGESRLDPCNEPLLNIIDGMGLSEHLLGYSTDRSASLEMWIWTSCIRVDAHCKLAMARFMPFVKI